MATGTPLATAFVRIRPDTKGFGGELKSDLSKSGKTFAAAGKKQGGLFKSGFASAFIAGGGLAAAAGLFQFGKGSVKAFTEAQTAQAKLSDAFARFPKLADVNKGALQALNTELAKKTKFDDDAFASGEAVLAQFGLTGKQVQGLSPLLADYAAKTGKDLPTAAKTLGRAFLGNTRALKDIGVNYKLTGNAAKDQAAITAILRRQVGGFATKEGKTAAGRAEILKNQFGELQEDVGAKLVPALTALAGALLKTIDFIGRNSKVIIPLVAAFGTFVGTLFAISKVFKIATAAARLFGITLNLSLGPVGLIITAVAALAVGLVLLYKNSETFRKIVNGVFNAVWGTIKTVWNWVKRNWPLLLGILTGPIGLATVLIVKNWKKIVDGVKSMLGKIKDFFSELPGNLVRWAGNLNRTLLEKGKDIIRGLWRGIKNIWNDVVGWFKDLPSKILSALGIHSPPDWAVDAGKNIMKGILQGVVPGGKDLLAFGKGVVAGLSTTLGGPQIRFGSGGGAIKGSPMEIAQRMVPEWATGVQWRALYDLWNNESGWNPRADNPTSTAFGIPQFLAGTAKQYGVFGSTDPARQIAAGLQYIADRYGSPLNAWNAWLSRSPHWYKMGTPWVPETGLAMLHRGEAVIPAKYNRRDAGAANIQYGPININVPPNTNLHEVGRLTVQALKAYERGSGSGWRK